jgi:protein-L-isoaspartate(D-aspartate) O-methyltransferase
MLQDTYRHKGMRKALVKVLMEKGITSGKILDAINTIPRHYFLEGAFLEHAYQDKAFPIGEGQTISQPYTVAFQTQLLDIQNGDKVLEIGTGSGYQTAILAHLGARIYTIEYNRNLFLKAKLLLAQLPYKINVFCGDGSLGLTAHAPFQKILVTAGAPAIPHALVEQLSPRGILVIPVGDNKQQQMIRISRKATNELSQEAFDMFSFVPLLGKNGWR